MKLPEILRSSVFQISREEEFNKTSLELFHYQYETIGVYRKMVKLLDIDPGRIDHYRQIPCLPVSLFRNYKILSGDEENIEKVFTSSTTTGSIPSRHYIRDLNLYEESFTKSFQMFYGDPGQYRFLALLPGYLERQGSSLVYMLDHFIRQTGRNGSAFYLHDLQALNEILEGDNEKIKTILFGASYGLLDFAEKYSPDLENSLIMETGGMKGRKREMIREELHNILCDRFNVDVIHSEYGMTELLSQAYSMGRGIFYSPPWMKILIRDVNDPLQYLQPGQTGGINIIDLANIYSCSFISTQDLGKINENGSFEVLGRFDNSDIRGCNLLVV